MLFGACPGSIKAVNPTLACLHTRQTVSLSRALCAHLAHISPPSEYPRELDSCTHPNYERTHHAKEEQPHVDLARRRRSDGRRRAPARTGTVLPPHAPDACPYG